MVGREILAATKMRSLERRKTPQSCAGEMGEAEERRREGLTKLLRGLPLRRVGGCCAAWMLLTSWTRVLVFAVFANRLAADWTELSMFGAPG